MNIVIVGATGFVGRQLVMSLQGRGHRLTALARDPSRARDTLPTGVRIADLRDDRELDDTVATADAIVNLAGEPIAGARWTARRKRALIASRVDVTRRLAAAIEARTTPLPSFVSASASGWYGDRGDEVLDDRSPPGTGFAASLCVAWEDAARAVPATRVAIARFGIILGRDGGALAALRPLYRFGLGGPIGDGRAWLPWIHLDDAVGALVHAIEQAALAGPFAVVAPEPVRQRDFARAYAHALRRPGIVRAPRIALRALLGESAEIVTNSQRVTPRALLDSGFEFTFPTLEGALADLADDHVDIERCVTMPNDSLYLQARGARYVLLARTELPAPRDEVFAFFSRPENLAALTPPSLGFQIVRDHEIAMERGAVIDYKIRVSGVPLKWRTWIEHWHPDEGFVDSQIKGPYRSWWHVHRFHDHGGSTVMEDCVYFSPPLAGLGRLVVEDKLRQIFAYRASAIRARFAGARETPERAMNVAFAQPSS